MFKKVIIAGVVALTIGSASAGCSSYGGYTSCSDGNTYNKVGNTTFGSNARTGNTWSQTTIGSTTLGRASDGSSWSHTRTESGGYGYDSSGGSFSYLD